MDNAKKEAKLREARRLSTMRKEDWARFVGYLPRQAAEDFSPRQIVELVKAEKLYAYKRIEKLRGAKKLCDLSREEWERFCMCLNDEDVFSCTVQEIADWAAHMKAIRKANRSLEGV